MLDLEVYTDNAWWRFRPLLSRTLLHRLCKRHLYLPTGKGIEDIHREFQNLVKLGFSNITGGLDIKDYLNDLSLDRDKVEKPKDKLSLLNRLFKLPHFRKQSIEAIVTEELVKPILDSILGWTPGKNYTVQVGQTGRADIMLNHKKDLRIPLEIEPPLHFKSLFKKSDKMRSGLYQLEDYVVGEYSRGNKIDYGILTDGFNWILYKWRNEGKFDGTPVLIFSLKKIYNELDFFKAFYAVLCAKNWSSLRAIPVEELWRERKPEEVRKEFYMVYQVLREYLKAYLDEPWLDKVPKILKNYYRSQRITPRSKIYDRFTLRSEDIKRLTQRSRLYETLKGNVKKREGKVIWLEDALTDDDYNRYRNDIRRLNEDVQKILDLIIILLFLDSRGILTVDLKEFIEKGYSTFEWIINGVNSGGATVGNIPIDGEIFNTEANRRVFQLIEKLYSVPASDGASPFVKVFNYLFDTYDFSPLVAEEGGISPEILGYVFERSMPLEERKSTGSYYTPEYVTEYIVKHTIKPVLERFIKDKTGKTFREILEEVEEVIGKAEENNVTVQELEKARDVIKSVIKALGEVKILDPACGSGSFLVKAFNFLYHEYYRPLQNLAEDLDTILRERSQTLDRWIPRGTFTLAKQIILDNIYGVDLNPYAVELAKITLLIALLSTIDLEELKQVPQAMKPHYGLPALRLNIRCGDSLIGLKIQDVIFELVKNYGEDLKRLSSLRKHFITASITDPSHALNQLYQIEQTIARLKSHLNDKLRNIMGINRLDRNPPMYWPLEFWHTYFDDYGNPIRDPGFHVVIGNPPYYTEVRGYKEKFRIYQKSPLVRDYYEQKMDVFYFFIELGLDLLKNMGKLGFIILEYWHSREHARRLREKMALEARLTNLVDFNDFKVFEQAKGQHNHIIILEKYRRKATEREIIQAIEVLDKDVSKEEVSAFLQGGNGANKIRKTGLEITYLIGEGRGNIELLPEKYVAILSKIEKSGKMHIHEDWISQGLVAPQEKISKEHIEKLNLSRDMKGRGIFVLSKSEKERMEFTEDEEKLIKPFFYPHKIDSYCYDDEVEEYVIYSQKSYIKYNNKEVERLGESTVMLELRETYRNIVRHLDKFQPIITSSLRPYGLHRPREIRIFESGYKIIGVRKTNYPRFAYVPIPYYMNQSVNYIILPKEYEHMVDYLVAILNSPVAAFFFKLKRRHGEVLQIDKGIISKLPIPEPRGNMLEKLSELSRELAKRKKLKIKLVNKFRHQIDLRREEGRLTSLYDALVEDGSKALWRFDIGGFKYPTKKSDEPPWNKRFDHFTAEIRYVDGKWRVIIYGIEDCSSDQIYAIAHDDPRMILLIYASMEVAIRYGGQIRTLDKLLKKAELLRAEIQANLNVINNILDEMEISPNQLLQYLQDIPEIEARINAEIFRIYGISRDEAKDIMDYIKIPSHIQGRIINKI